MVFNGFFMFLSPSSGCLLCCVIFLSLETSDAGIEQETQRDDLFSVSGNSSLSGGSMNTHSHESVSSHIQLWNMRVCFIDEN